MSEWLKIPVIRPFLRTPSRCREVRNCVLSIAVWAVNRRSVPIGVASGPPRPRSWSNVDRARRRSSAQRCSAPRSAAARADEVVAQQQRSDADQTGGERGDEDCEGRLLRECASSSNARIEMKIATVKPMPFSGAIAAIAAQSSLPGRVAPVARARPSGSRIPPTGAPTTRPSRIPRPTGAVRASARPPTAHFDAGVGEREDRQHDIGGPRVQGVLHPGERRSASRDRRETSDIVASLTSSSGSATSLPSWSAMAWLVSRRG